MKVTTAVLVSIACITYFAASSPIEEADYHNGGGYGGGNHDGGNHDGGNQWKDGYEDWYCVKKDSHGNQCVVASAEHSPCQHGGKYMGCDDHRQHCWGCSVNNNKDWMWNQMKDWCHGQHGSLEKSKGNWHKC